MHKSTMLFSMLVIILLLSTFAVADPNQSSLVSDTCDLQLPGDANGDGLRNIDDADFLEDFFYADGPAPDPLANGDANGDCIINPDDYNYIYDHVMDSIPFTLECTCVSPLYPDTCYGGYIPGDVNGDDRVNIGDYAALSNIIFKGAPITRAADINGDCIINISDYVCLFDFIDLWPNGCLLALCTCLDPQRGEVDTCYSQLPGDANNDQAINASDPIYLLEYFGNGGPAPDPLYNADLNGDCVVDSLDVAQSVGFLFKCGKDTKCGYTPVDCTCMEPEIGEYFQEPCAEELPGDANSDGDINLGDAVLIVNYIFKYGNEPFPYKEINGDPNCDCSINIGDAIYIINFTFKGGPEPCDCQKLHNDCDINDAMFDWLQKR